LGCVLSGDVRGGAVAICGVRGDCARRFSGRGTRRLGTSDTGRFDPDYYYEDDLGERRWSVRRGPPRDGRALDGRELDGRWPDGREDDERGLNGRGPDGRSPDGRGENFGLFGLKVLVNEPLGFPEGALDERGVKFALVVRLSVLENEPPDLLGADSRVSVLGVKFDPADFLPYFANAFGFANFEGRSADDRGGNSGRFGFEVFANELFDLPGDDGRAPDERRAKLGLALLESGLANEPAGFAEIDWRESGRESGRGVNFGRAGLPSYFANDLLGFENVEAR
jgi:hypothetical protein